jgi:hypothetical protein
MAPTLPHPDRVVQAGRARPAPVDGTAAVRRLATPLARRIAAFALFALILYGVAPAVAEVLGAWPGVRRYGPSGTLAYRLLSYWLLLPAGAVAWALHGRLAPRPLPGEVVHHP